MKNQTKAIRHFVILKDIIDSLGYADSWFVMRDILGKGRDAEIEAAITGLVINVGKQVKNSILIKPRSFSLRLGRIFKKTTGWKGYFMLNNYNYVMYRGYSERVGEKDNSYRYKIVKKAIQQELPFILLDNKNKRIIT